MKSFITLALLNLLFSGQVFSPEKAIWENETLLGANEYNFYTLKAYRHINGNYYFTVDSVFLLEKSLGSGKVLAKVVLRVVENIDEDGNGNWQHSDRFTNQLDIIGYLRKKKASLIYAKNFTGLTFKLGNEGLMLNNKENETQLVSRQYIGNYIPWFAEYLDYQQAYPGDPDFQVRVSQEYQSASHIFLVVEAGASQGDTDFKQGIIVLSQDKFRVAKKLIGK